MVVERVRGLELHHSQTGAQQPRWRPRIFPRRGNGTPGGSGVCVYCLGRRRDADVRAGFERKGNCGMRGRGNGNAVESSRAAGVVFAVEACPPRRRVRKSPREELEAAGIGGIVGRASCRAASGLSTWDVRFPRSAKAPEQKSSSRRRQQQRGPPPHRHPPLLGIGSGSSVHGPAGISCSRRSSVYAQLVAIPYMYCQPLSVFCCACREGFAGIAESLRGVVHSAAGSILTVNSSRSAVHLGSEFVGLKLPVLSIGYTNTIAIGPLNTPPGDNSAKFITRRTWVDDIASKLFTSQYKIRLGGGLAVLRALQAQTDQCGILPELHKPEDLILRPHNSLSSNLSFCVLAASGGPSDVSDQNCACGAPRVLICSSIFRVASGDAVVFFAAFSNEYRQSFRSIASNPSGNFVICFRHVLTMIDKERSPSLFYGRLYTTKVPRKQEMYNYATCRNQRRILPRKGCQARFAQYRPQAVDYFSGISKKGFRFTDAGEEGQNPRADTLERTDGDKTPIFAVFLGASGAGANAAARAREKIEVDKSLSSEVRKGKTMQRNKTDQFGSAAECGRRKARDPVVVATNEYVFGYAQFHAERALEFGLGDGPGHEGVVNGGPHRGAAVQVAGTSVPGVEAAVLEMQLHLVLGLCATGNDAQGPGTVTIGDVQIDLLLGNSTKTAGCDGGGSGAAWGGGASHSVGGPRGIRNFGSKRRGKVKNHRGIKNMASGDQFGSQNRMRDEGAPRERREDAQQGGEGAERREGGRENAWCEMEKRKTHSGNSAGDSGVRSTKLRFGLPLGDRSSIPGLAAVCRASAAISPPPDDANDDFILGHTGAVAARDALLVPPASVLSGDDVALNNGPRPDVNDHSELEYLNEYPVPLMTPLNFIDRRSPLAPAFPRWQLWAPHAKHENDDAGQTGGFFVLHANHDDTAGDLVEQVAAASCGAGGRVRSEDGARHKRDDAPYGPAPSAPLSGESEDEWLPPPFHFPSPSLTDEVLSSPEFGTTVLNSPQRADPAIRPHERRGHEQLLRRVRATLARSPPRTTRATSWASPSAALSPSLSGAPYSSAAAGDCGGAVSARARPNPQQGRVPVPSPTEETARPTSTNRWQLARPMMPPMPATSSSSRGDFLTRLRGGQASTVNTTPAALEDSTAFSFPRPRMPQFPRPTPAPPHHRPSAQTPRERRHAAAVLGSRRRPPSRRVSHCPAAGRYADANGAAAPQSGCDAARVLAHARRP
ncbi:hypothetical protein B0H16DRAFT_1447454 [Mycena metata]|uniref:Uncharacterized protein n=1 Tax=Mycena metata TaxID=1033252 RepID=A0AAD7P170_9AGAR|nr:hypothetical protein B0H16DRAFT_1447454 [Mycena metata]